MKKCLSILLVIATILTCLPAVPFLHTHAEASWDGTVATGFASGSGTPGSPYVIETVGQLVYLAISVNQGNSYEGVYLSLANDIVFSPSDFAEGGSLYNDGNGWTPIGQHTTCPFLGHFEGNGHSIRNLVISYNGIGLIHAGLFGYTKGTIRNLNMDNCRVEVTADPSETTAVIQIYAGSVAGCVVNSGVVTGCTSNSTVTVNARANQGVVSDYVIYAGGIMGYTLGRDATLSPISCTNSGAVTVNFDLTKGYASTAYVGGISGYSGSYIADSTNSGNITINSSRRTPYASTGKMHAGGIAGTSQYYGLTENCGDIHNSTNMGVVCVDALDENTGGTGNKINYLYTYAGGITGYATTADLTGCRNDAAVISKANAINKGASSYSPRADAAAGGIAGGYSGGTIKDCINNATISADTIYDSTKRISRTAASKGQGPSPRRLMMPSTSLPGWAVMPWAASTSAAGRLITWA